MYFHDRCLGNNLIVDRIWQVRDVTLTLLTCLYTEPAAVVSVRVGVCRVKCVCGFICCGCRNEYESTHSLVTPVSNSQ